ncbi:MAG: hypothetical protein V4757_02010 [Pseudomonadota bacterium]
MSRFRLFLAWLIVAAVPLQGLAASSMLYCGPGEHHGTAQVASVQGNLDSDSGIANAISDHSSHGSAVVGEAEKSAGSSGEKLPAAAHKCAVCASCCSFLAIPEVSELTVLAPAERAEFSEPFVLFHIRPSQVPDKPPRA